MLAEAESEILRHEYRADLAENSICELKRQIDSQAVEIGHTRTGHEQSRREQALLHEELADRDRALRDSRVGSFHKLKELKREQEFRLEEFSIRKLVDLLRCRICTQWRIISRSNSTSVMSSSPWNRKIAKPRLKFAAQYLGHAWYYRETFLQIQSVFFDNLFRNAQSLELISLLREIFRCKWAWGDPW